MNNDEKIVVDNKEELVEKKSKKKIVVIASIVIAVILVIGITYAYFSSRSNTVSKTVTTSTLKIDFEDGDLINAEDIEPVYDENIETEATKKHFKVTKNTNSEAVVARIKLTDVAISANFKDANFMWKLYEEGEEKANGNFGSIGSATTLDLASGITLDNTTPKEYDLYIWIHETDDLQNDLQGGSFTAKITVEGEAVE